MPALSTTSDLRIHTRRDLTEAELEALFRFEFEPFGPESASYHWRPKELHFIGYINAQPLSHVALVKAAVNVGARRLLVAGLGGVISRPEARGRGYARQLITCSMDFARQSWKLDFGLLFCWPHNTRFYACQGWQLIPTPVTVGQPSGPVHLPTDTMVLPLTDQAWPAGALHVPGLPW